MPEEQSGAQTLRSFLMRLGFVVDESGQKKFARSVAVQTELVRELAEGLKGVAEKVVRFGVNMAEGLNNLYYAAQRSNSTVEKLEALKFAAGQTGLSVDDVVSSFQNLQKYLDSNPGGGAIINGFLGQIGKTAYDANGNLRDTHDLLLDLQQATAAMINSQDAGVRATGFSWADMFGESRNFAKVDNENLRNADTRGQQKHKGDNDLGFDAAKFKQQWNDLSDSFTTAAERMAAPIMREVLPAMGDLAKWIDGHIPQIKAAITSFSEEFAHWVRVASDWGETITGKVGGAIKAVISWWDALSPKTKDLIKTIGGFIVKWALLYGGITAVVSVVSAVVGAFLAVAAAVATPIGVVATLVSGIWSLWDSFQAWKKGSKTFIDWGEWAPQIDAAVDGIKAVWNELKTLGSWIAGIAVIIYDKLKPALDWFGDAFKRAIKDTVYYVLDDIILVTDILTGQWSKAAKIIKDGALGKARPVEKQPAPPVDHTADQENDSAVPANGHQARGFRNRNFGNIAYGKFAREHGAAGNDNGLAIFGSISQGINAMIDLLQRYAKQGLHTVRQIISKWAPEFDANGKKINNTKEYIASLAKRLGISADANVNLNDATQLYGLLSGITQFENGSNPYKAEISAAVKARTGSAPAPVTVQQTNHITVTGAANPKDTAREIERALGKVNQNAVRTFAPRST
jgi:hypothetical protein